jgi:hypothetical protein
MISAVGDEIIALCITFLTNSEYIKNPYLKAKLVSLLFHGTWPIYHRTKGVLGDALTGTKFANDHLLHALMKFYIGKSCRASGIIHAHSYQRSSQLAHIHSSMTSSIFVTRSSKLSSASGQIMSTSNASLRRASKNPRMSSRGRELTYPGPT